MILSKKKCFFLTANRTGKLFHTFSLFSFLYNLYMVSEYVKDFFPLNLAILSNTKYTENQLEVLSFSQCLAELLGADPQFPEPFSQEKDCISL